MGNRIAAGRRAVALGAIAGALLIGTGANAGAAECALVSMVVCPDTTSTTSAPPSTTSTTSIADARAQLLSLVNAERSRAGLVQLVTRPDVDGIASQWSEAMADAGAISHDDAFFTAASHERLGAVVLGENVARAADVEQAHRALMASEHHRDNILDSRFTVVGIGLSFRGGAWWITQDFLQPSLSVASAPRQRREPSATRVTAAQVASTSTTLPVVLDAHLPSPPIAPDRDVVVLPRVDRAPLGATLADGADDSDELRRNMGAAALVLALVGGALRRRLAAIE